MKVLFIGTGSIGKRHCVNLKKLVPDVELYFFRNNSQQDDFSKQMNAKIISSMDQITNEIEAAFLCTPSFLRREIYEKIFDLNIPLYAEKPLVTSIEDVIWLKSKVALQSYTASSLIGFNLRFLPVLNFVKDFLASDKLGKICRAFFEVGQYLPEWRPNVDYRNVYSAQKSMGGGVVLDLLHEVDLAFHLFGDFSFALIASGKFSGLEIDSEDTAAIILRRDSNPIVTINMDYVARKTLRQFRIVGDSATLFCDLIGKRLLIEGCNLHEEVSLGDNFYDVEASYMTAIGDFLKAVKGNYSTSYPLFASLPMHELILEKMQ